MNRLWVKEIIRHKIARQATLECPPGGEREALTEICRALDVPNPMWLDKHAREFDSFQRTAFSKDCFVEHVGFERLEIEMIDEDASKSRKSDDPRNEF